MKRDRSTARKELSNEVPIVTLSDVPFGESKEPGRASPTARASGSLPYFAAACAHLASVVRNGLALDGASTSPFNDAGKVTMCP
jgi:hypothetical protein